MLKRPTISSILERIQWELLNWVGDYNCENAQKNPHYLDQPEAQEWRITNGKHTCPLADYCGNMGYLLSGSLSVLL